MEVAVDSHAAAAALAMHGLAHEDPVVADRDQLPNRPLDSLRLEEELEELSELFCAVTRLHLEELARRVVVDRRIAEIRDGRVRVVDRGAEGRDPIPDGLDVVLGHASCGAQAESARATCSNRPAASRASFGFRYVLQYTTLLPRNRQR
jgi:hypothetical protein